MYRRILAAIDSSEISRLALGQAVRLAQALEATIRLVHGVDQVTTNTYKPADMDRFVNSHREAGQALLDEAATVVRDAGVQCEERVLDIDVIGRGRLPEAIVREADSWGADLILLGTHARRGVSHLLLGSVAEGVVLIASKPVLVVSADAAKAAADLEDPIGNLLVAVDGTPASEPALGEAIRLARDLGRQLRVVFAQEGAAAGGGDGGRATAVLEAAQAAAREAGVEAQTRVLEGSRAGGIADAVVAEAGAWPARMIVLGTHGRQGLERLLVGSVAEAVLHRSAVPVLLVRSAGGD